MKRVVVLSAIALLAGAGLLRLAQHDPGYVLIVVAGKSIEMRFWMAVLVLVFTAALIYYAVRWALAVGDKLTDRGWWTFRGKRQKRAEDKLRQGILRVFEGDYQEADRLLKGVVKVMPNDALALVASSESAMRTGQAETARQRLQESHGQNSKDAISVELAEVRTLISDGRLQQALAQLLVIKTRYKRNPSVLLLLQQLLQSLQDWQALEALLPEIERSGAKHLLDWQQLQKLTYRELLLSSSEAPEPLEQIESVWRRVPKSIKEHPELLAVYCRLLVSFECYQKVSDLVRKALKKTWSDELVELYGLLPAADPRKQFNVATSWLEQHPEDPVLHLCIGRVAVRNELWGQAKEHYEHSLRLAPMPATYAELARLLDHMGEQQESLSLFRQGLLNAAPKLVALPKTSDLSSSP